MKTFSVQPNGSKTIKRREKNMYNATTTTAKIHNLKTRKQMMKKKERKKLKY